MYCMYIQMNLFYFIFWVKCIGNIDWYVIVRYVHCLEIFGFESWGVSYVNQPNRHFQAVTQDGYHVSET